MNTLCHLDPGHAKTMMNDRRSFLRRLLGDSYPLAKHFAEITVLFLILLLCLFILRHTIPWLFPPGEKLTKVLHIVDAYAALLGTVGYGIWITLDMLAVLFERARAFARTVRRQSDERDL